MNKIQKRFLLFLIGCIGIRISFVFIAKNIDEKYLPLLGYLALIPALGFGYIYLSNARKTGGEVFGDKIWWNHLRPIHSILYFLFAYYAINRNINSWKFLSIDVFIGLVSFLSYHYISGNFTLLKTL